MSLTGAYTITTHKQVTMFGKRTGGVIARLESDYSANIASAAGPTTTLAKAALINQLGRMAERTERAYVFCGDGKTVLPVYFAMDSWQYDIVSADREGCRSGCIMPGCESFERAKERAWEHAGQSYGGVVNTL